MSKILVVDDEEMMLMMARHILSSKYEVVTATTGVEAIEIFKEEQPDMVLSDLMMPEIDGYELHRILQEQSGVTIPMMFMSANEGDESETKSFEVGAADYIHKPFKPDVLLRRVGNILDNLDKLHKLEVAASIDTLTGLLNKATAQKEIAECLKTSLGALLMIDLDSFKLVNDIYGHAMGDKILIRFAELIRKIIRENDLAGRMGGDEFIAFLQGVNNEKILHYKAVFLNEQILIVAKKLMGSNMQIPLGVSVGAVFVTDEGKDFLSLYKKADGALYDVKQHGKHGLAIFGARDHSKNLSVEGLSQLRMILEERNKKSGAYVVDFETFKKIYQLMVRMVDNYKKGVMIMQFTIPTDNEKEEFADVLVRSLRCSDCVSQSGRKFFVLLMEATESESDIVRDRIFSRCRKSLVDKISFEREKIS
ncbi:MAG: diguanylate cyclase [Quinella sp. 1Q5]|nr:diguanylate cyclase [Quinella sp. 1Q5]